MRTCHHKTIEKCTGWFHGFFQMGNLEHGCDPVALVEIESGEIMEVDASGIIFEDASQNVMEAKPEPTPNKKSIQLCSCGNEAQYVLCDDCLCDKIFEARRPA